MSQVLVIDDDEDLRSVLKTVLEGAGHEVRVAVNGAEGLQLQRRSPAEIAVVDIIMPEMEGIETIYTLKREFPRLPIVAMSGGGANIGSDYLSAATGVGADHVLQKPFAATRLVEVVRESLGSHTLSSSDRRLN